MLLSEEKIITDTDDKNENLDSFLKDVKLIKEIQSNINKLIYEQSEQIDIIDNNLDSTSDKLIESNNYLETATKYKVKMKPLTELNKDFSKVITSYDTLGRINSKSLSTFLC